MNLLVTGAAGFIGSHFVLRHSEQYPGDKIVVLDLLTYAGSKDLLAPVAAKITFVKGDIADSKLVASLIKDHAIDVVINFAAETHVDRSITDALPFIHTNITGVQVLCEVIRDYPQTKLFHISTDEVYGDLQDNDAPYKLGDPLTPSSPYAASKAAGEMRVTTDTLPGDLLTEFERPADILTMLIVLHYDPREPVVECINVTKIAKTVRLYVIDTINMRYIDSLKNSVECLTSCDEKNL
jgi:NAD(P)-dependent dehydrogenase (short-subunit alcohol dehydrogenase family)